MRPMSLCCLPPKRPRIEDEKRNKFSCIPLHLQVRIAEKIDYFEQMMFESSSKYGRNLLKLTQHKAVVKINLIVVNDNDTKFSCFLRTPKHPNGKYRELEWTMLRFVSGLPRFTVSQLLINENLSVKSVLELTEQITFCENEVVLEVTRMTPSREIFDLLTRTFNITSLNVNGPPEDCMNLPWFRNSLSMVIDSIPDDQLVQLMASTLQLTECSNSSRISSLANQFFQQWSRKTRNIAYLFLGAGTDRQILKGVFINTNILMNGLSFTKIARGSGLTARHTDESYRTYTIDEESYLIGREGCKLLIRVYDSNINTSIHAEEVTEVTRFKVRIVPSE